MSVIDFSRNPGTLFVRVPEGEVAVVLVDQRSEDDPDVFVSTLVHRAGGIERLGTELGTGSAPIRNTDDLKHFLIFAHKAATGPDKFDIKALSENGKKLPVIDRRGNPITGYTFSLNIFDLEVRPI
jgi:hypothetical protein